MEHRGKDAGGLAHALEPVIRSQCETMCGARLSALSWFRADWQRGGASTAYAVATLEGGETREALVKMPVGPTEYRVTVALSAMDAPTPRVIAHGLELGGYDLAWLVMERLPGQPLTTGLHREVFAELCAAAAGFQKHALRAFPMEGDGATRLTSAPADPDWGALIDKARHAVKDSRIPEASKWNDALKHAQKALPGLLSAWRARPINAWRHGDLHAGNAMRRPEGSPWGPAGCVLLDFAEVQPGHWVEDAVYLERMHWGALIPQGHEGAGKPALEGVKTVSLLAKARKALGMETEGDYGMLANIRRALTAASVPAFLDREGTKGHLHAALETLERLLPIVGK